MSARTVKTAVIGLNAGITHVQNYQTLANAELAALCDISEPWLAHCQREYGVPQAYTDYRELLARSDAEAVSLCLPTHLHLPVTLACLQAGKHVLVEKPMAMNAEEGVAMANAAEAAGRLLMVSFNQRFEQGSQFLKRHIDAGGLGDIYFARAIWRRPMGLIPTPLQPRPTGAYNRNWFNEADKGGGVGRDLGAHVIDLALWMMGFPEPVDIVGRSYAHFGPDFTRAWGARFDVDDHTVGFVRFANGASLHVEVSFGQHTGHEEVLNEFYGTKGGASRGGFTGGLELYGQAPGGYTTITPRFTEPAGSTQGHFVDCIANGAVPMITPAQGIAVTRLIDELYASSRTFVARSQ
jgi:predicted dehydrogenase